MDPFAFNGAVLGLDAGAPAAASSSPAASKLAAAAAAASAPPQRAAPKGQRAQQRKEAPGSSAAASSSAAGPFSIARATADEQAKSAGHHQSAGKKKHASASTPAPTAAAKPAQPTKQPATAAAPALKSALKPASRVTAPSPTERRARAAAAAPAERGSANSEGLRALTAKLTAPPPAEDPHAAAARDAAAAAGSTRQQMRKTATELAREPTEADKEAAKAKEAAKEARFASVKAKVKEAKAALVQRQKQVSTRQPDVAADPDTARDRLFGKPPPSALAADHHDSDDAADGEEQASVASSSSSDGAAAPDTAAAAAAAAEEVEEEDLPPLQELLHPRLAQAVDAMGITQLTRVQKLAWRPMVSENDVLVRSETGSGKTLAYGLPMLHQLLKRCDVQPIKRETAGTICIVMAPTRELAEQCSTVLTKCVRKANFIVVGAIHGGEDRHKEKARLRKGITVLVATPGRLLDHLNSTAAFAHHNLDTVVMDEADRLLDMGFERSIAGIMEIVRPRKRILVSATITPAVERLSHFALQKPIRVGETEDKFEVPTSLRQHYTVVPCKHRLVALTAVLLAQLEAAARKIIVFVSTADATEFMYLLFSRLRSPFDKSKPDPAAALTQLRGGQASAAKRAGAGFGRKKDVERANRHVREGGAAEELDGHDASGLEGAIAAAKRRAMESLAAKTSTGGALADDDALLKCNVFKLHGNMTQVDRTSVFNSFRECDKGVLFCTDVAARGLDMPAVSWIIHFDPPTDDRSYIHRIGRTARIGSIGDSLLFLMEHERDFVPEYLANATNSAIREKPLSVLMYHLSRIDGNAPSWADSAAKLQHAAANLVKYDEVLNRVALFAYRSMIRAYAAYPREVRRFFDQSQLHLGHVAASFAIDATPTELRRAGHKHANEDRQLGRDRARFRKEGAQVQLDTRETYRSTLATKASRETKNWIEQKRAEGSLYKPIGHSSTAEFDA
eukprot:CAMPEP_0174829016 /NCGR_PEP_ID=MMETSP1114-20130205/1670_1 /TAXON_ID=312471 /ORGANISM="Neobodo designis, Strain CCAP 1951/1" /LENGTH=964 /DNA_ID=CAMNT_0016062751 /DNA_START=62 /DNA_END=2956 /DNA_ORIENTATION=+